MRTEPPVGRRGWPLVGNTVQFLRDPFGFYEACAARGDVVRYSVGGEEQYLLSHPRDVERVLATDEDAFRKGDTQRERLGSVLGDGVLTATGETWREQRSLVDPAFGFDRMARYAPTMVDRARAVGDDWRDGEVVALDDEMRRLTLGILVRAVFGTDLDRHERTVAEATDALSTMGDITRPGFFLPDWLPTPADRRGEAALADLHDIVAELVADARAADEAGDDLLAVLVRATDGADAALSETQLRDQLVTFLLAGHETTALALAYTWFELGRNPDVADRFRAEVDDLGGSPAFDDLEDLPYTEAVLREAMRLHPPVPRMVREATERAEVGGYRLEPGDRVTLPQHVVHRDGRWWDEPDAFRPARWLDGADRPTYAYFPFGGGPRRCLGMWFARVEGQLALAELGRRFAFDLRSSDEPDVSLSATARPVDPIEAVVRER